MSGLSVFLKQNVLPDENIKYVASQRFVGEDGKPVEWEIKSISSAEDDAIRNSCTTTVRVPGKRNQFTKDVDSSKYLGKMAAACTVFPDLNNAELQDSYGVLGADVLLKAMLKPGEYNDYVAKVTEANRFDVSMEEMVEDAKN